MDQELSRLSEANPIGHDEAVAATDRIGFGQLSANVRLTPSTPRVSRKTLVISALAVAMLAAVSVLATQLDRGGKATLSASDHAQRSAQGPARIPGDAVLPDSTGPASSTTTSTGTPPGEETHNALSNSIDATIAANPAVFVAASSVGGRLLVAVSPNRDAEAAALLQAFPAASYELKHCGLERPDIARERAAIASMLLAQGLTFADNFDVGTCAVQVLVNTVDEARARELLTGSYPAAQVVGAGTIERDSLPLSATGRTAVSARINLPTKVIVTGTTVNAELVVNNQTGTPIDGAACGSPFALALSNDSVHQQIVFLRCGRSFQIPVGESRYPLTIVASYLQCGQAGPGPVCVDGTAPPLPPGAYQLTLLQSSPFVSAPKPITIHVTRAGAHGS